MEEAKRWIPEMMSLGMKAMILDLRFNGGGLLTEAQRVAELFLPKGKVVVSTKGPDESHPGKETEVTYSTRVGKPALPLDMPLVVLTGRNTASAAEIVSGALQDHKRAELVGTTTYGKGSVQQLIPIMVKELQDEWEDENGNQMHDPWEEIKVDHNGNGEVDYAPRVKLTIAQYLLPSRRSINRDIGRAGTIKNEGGVKPDDEVEAPSVEAWRIREQRRIRPAVHQHIEETYAENRELYNRLAFNDLRQPDLYPGFAKLMESLATTLSPDDVRRVLRYEVRRRVQDDRGAEFPYGDFVEDIQLQKAIEAALGKLGEKPTDVNDYNLVFDLPETGHGEIALAGPNRSLELTRALTLLRSARADDKALTPEEVDQLIQILGTIGKN